MAVEHTPGPWHCSPEADLHRIGVYAGNGDEIIICDVSDEDVVIDGQCEANARLIAAAPKLLAACEALVRRNQKHADLDRAIEAGEAAIAEATGQKGA
jgi:hypothetical protein